MPRQVSADKPRLTVTGTAGGKTYRGILFDLDGVLCHTDRLHYEAWSELCDQLGLQFNETLNGRLRGVSRTESFKLILRANSIAMSDAEIDLWTSRKNELYLALVERLTPSDSDPAILAMLDRLHHKGLLCAVASSSKNARTIMNRLGLTSRIDAVADGNDITRSKPDPQVFLMAARRLGLPCGDCLAVEDARSGIDAALAGGIDCAATGDALGYEKAT